LLQALPDGPVSKAHLEDSLPAHVEAIEVARQVGIVGEEVVVETTEVVRGVTLNA
jgi:hypothetical protein